MRIFVFVFVCLFVFLFVLLFMFSLEAIKAYKLHKLREWTKSIGGKGESIWNGMKIKPFGETTQRNHLCIGQIEASTSPPPSPSAHTSGI